MGISDSTGIWRERERELCFCFQALNMHPQLLMRQAGRVMAPNRKGQQLGQWIQSLWDPGRGGNAEDRRMYICDVDWTEGGNVSLGWRTGERSWDPLARGSCQVRRASGVLANHSSLCGQLICLGKRSNTYINSVSTGFLFLFFISFKITEEIHIYTGKCTNDY